jgi:hypothetical protein
MSAGGRGRAASRAAPLGAGRWPGKPGIFGPKNPGLAAPGVPGLWSCLLGIVVSAVVAHSLLLAFLHATFLAQHLPNVAKQGGRSAPVPPNVAETSSDPFKIADTPRSREVTFHGRCTFLETRQKHAHRGRGVFRPCFRVGFTPPPWLPRATGGGGPRFPGLSALGPRSGRRPASSTVCRAGGSADLRRSGCLRSAGTTSDPGRGACGAVP